MLIVAGPVRLGFGARLRESLYFGACLVRILFRVECYYGNNFPFFSILVFFDRLYLLLCSKKMFFGSQTTDAMMKQSEREYGIILSLYQSWFVMPTTSTLSYDRLFVPTPPKHTKMSTLDTNKMLHDTTTNTKTARLDGVVERKQKVANEQARR